MTSSTTGDRRWGTTRRSGMTILGKVTVPKPINLPSQRLENQGLDPNVEIVPKGTLSWGSKPSLNAWGTSSLSPRTESVPGSPSHLSNRPSSGGSVTRPSTADSNKAHDSSIAWDSNSRPSSASGVFPSNQVSAALQRPHSADTRPGSSQLSRFAEAMSETSETWDQHGVAPTKGDRFSLTSRDFPSLGTGKESSEKSTRPQDAGPRGRPASSSGRSVEERGVDCTEESNVRARDANTWRRDNQPYSEDAPRHCRDEEQLNFHGSQSYPNANFPYQYDTFRGPPVINHQSGGWYRGNHPYGAPMGPGGFHMDPFPFYPMQVPPVPGHGAGPRGNHGTNGKIFRPPMVDSYVHPRMQTRPGIYPGPVPHESYYGPPMGYSSLSNRDLPFAGRPAGPHAYNKNSGQCGYDTSRNLVSLEQNEPSHSQEKQRPYKVLLKPQDGRFGEDEAKREEFLGNRFLNADKITQQTQGRADHQTEQKTNSEGNDGWRNTTMPGSSHATLAASSESFTEINVGDSLDTDSMGKAGSLISADPNDRQRTKMRELARQRVQQRQKEEEERARDQRAKALAKLEELNRRSQVAEEGSVKNLEAASNPSIPDMPVDPPSYLPALITSKSDDVRICSSLEMKTTVAPGKSIRSTGELGKTSMQDQNAPTSTDYENNVGSTQQDNLLYDCDGAALKQKRLGYKQKQDIAFEKKMAGNSFSVATTDAFDVVPSPVVSNSDMPATSSVSTESTFTKRKNNRNGKKKHKVEETISNPTGAAVGKEKKLGDESTETGRAKAAEMELGSVSIPSLDIKVSGNSSEQISSFANEESQSRAKTNSKSQHLRRTQRSSLVNKPAEKFHGCNAVIWAPIHPQQKANISTGVVSQNTVPEFGTSSKSLHQGQTNSKSKRVEIERYVAKPIVNEITGQIVRKNLIPAAPEMTDNVLRKENGGREATEILHTFGSTARKSGSPSMSGHGNGRQGKHFREHGAWHQRGSAASTKALEDGPFVTSNQLTYHTSNQPKQTDVGSDKDQTTCNDDGWKDGWYMTPETHYSAPEEVKASAPQAGSVGKDQAINIHGKQHASRSNKDGGSNYGDPKKANKTDSSKAHMQQSGHGLGQPDLPVASKDSHGPGDHVLNTAVTPNRTGKHGGREYMRDKTYGSQKRDVSGYEHQRFTSEQKMISADTPAQSQTRSTNKEVQVEQNPSMFQKNTSQNPRFARGQESQRGLGSSVQENIHHHHQRPTSNRDKQKQKPRYEYKPVGSHTYDEHNQEQLKDSSQTEGSKLREKGQEHQRHGGKKLYQQQRSTAGRNTGHGLTGERN